MPKVSKFSDEQKFEIANGEGRPAFACPWSSRWISERASAPREGLKCDSLPLTRCREWHLSLPLCFCFFRLCLLFCVLPSGLLGAADVAGPLARFR